MSRKKKKKNRDQSSASSELDSVLSEFRGTKLKNGQSPSKGENGILAQLGNKDVVINFGQQTVTDTILERVETALKADCQGDWRISKL